MSTTVVKRSVEQAIAPPSRRKPPALDWLMILAVCGLMTASLISIAGATSTDVAGDPGYFTIRQAVYFGLGMVVAIGLARLDYGALEGLRRVAWWVLIATNLSVFVLAGSTRGSHRWISLPFFQLQPSELGKALLVVALAGLGAEAARRIDQPRTTLRLVGRAVLPAVIVAMQPDLGTALVYIAILAMILVAAGTPARQLGVLAGATMGIVVMVLAVMPAAGINVLRPYQVQRLTGFVNPSSDPAAATYQVNQSLIAIGAGQRLGRGQEGSTQTGLDFLPEHHTDFIFAVIGERWGFVGAAIVLSLYALLLWRAMRLVLLARDMFGSLLAAGIVAILGFQAFVNVGMTLGVMPITGVPLPLMSYGGSSVLVTFICLGLLQSVHLRSAHPAEASMRARVRI